MNFRKLCRAALVFFLIIVLQGNAIAATIHGTVYKWDTFNPLNNSVIEINSTPEQNVVAKDSEYSFNLTPGTYMINASYLEGDKIVYTARDEVVISDDGEYIHDLLLFPPSHEELLNQDNLEAPNLDYKGTGPVSQANYQYAVLASALVALIVLLFAGYFLKRRHDKLATVVFPEINREPYLSESDESTKDEIFSKEADTHSAENTAGISELSSEQFVEKSEGASKTETLIQQRSKLAEAPEDRPDSSFHEAEPNKPASEASKHPKHNLPEDLREILELVRASGNRITQRELRKKSPYSESKVSLMLSDLEERGLIEKFKKGRGNIIRIPDMHISRQKKRESKKE